MLTTGNISLGPFFGLLDSMKNTNTSLRDIILKIFSQTRLQWVWTNQCYFWVEPPADCGFGEFSRHIDWRYCSFSFYQDEKNQLLTTCMWFNLVRNSLLRKNKGKSIDNIWVSQLQRPSWPSLWLSRLGKTIRWRGIPLSSGELNQSSSILNISGLRTYSSITGL